jgi:hypothetical protein
VLPPDSGGLFIPTADLRRETKALSARNSLYKSRGCGYNEKNTKEGNSMGCPIMTGACADRMMSFGVFVVFAVWILFVPVVITARLERMIKLLEELNKKK